jgi:hypothetical protein
MYFELFVVLRSRKPLEVIAAALFSKPDRYTKKKAYQE